MTGRDDWLRAWKLRRALEAAGADASVLWANGVGPRPPVLDVPIPREELDATAARHARGLSYFSRSSRGEYPPTRRARPEGSEVVGFESRSVGPYGSCFPKEYVE